MKQVLFSEYRTLYALNWGQPWVMRLRVRMRDLIDADTMRYAVDDTMKRYPYFCVELKKDDEYYLSENTRPVVISSSLHGVALNTAESNYHLISFSFSANWVIMDIAHAITDGSGAYAVIRTFLHYYMSKKYGVDLHGNETRLCGEEICIEEWEDPVVNRTDLPVPIKPNFSNAINVRRSAGLETDQRPTVFTVAIPEKEFMRFNIENDGSPATMVSLFLSRSIHRLYPTEEDSIRVVMTVNERKALNAPLAHQNLVSSAFLEYKKQIWNWPLGRQATAYRGMVFAQSRDENVLNEVASQKQLNQLIQSKPTDEERTAVCEMSDKIGGSFVTAAVSYVGKGNFDAEEKYIRDFHLWTNGKGDGILIEISAVSGKFIIDFMQPFSNPLYLNSFLKELDDNDITYDLQDVMDLELPNVSLPWMK